MVSSSLRKAFPVVALALSFIGFITPLQAQWQVGDVFVGVGKGSYLVYRFNGTNYALVQTIGVAGFGSSDQTSGCAFDSQLNFYATDATSGKVSELNNSGLSAVPFQTLTTGAGTTSVMFDSSGNLYVGLGSVKGVPPGKGLLKYVPNLPPNTSTGNISYPGSATGTFNPSESSDWIDLANDQKTLYLTNETTSVEKENLSATTPSPAIFSTPGVNQNAFAVRILSPFDGSGGFLVADSNHVVKLDSTGTIPTFYTFGNSSNLRALTLDPNGTSAWVADFKTGNVFRFNIASGGVEFTIATPGGSTPNGLCTKGGPELNVVPLVYKVGTNVTAVAGFGAPGTKNFHTWQATFDQILANFVLVVTATEGIDLSRFNEYFPGQAGSTLIPIPYADQVDFGGNPIKGHPVVYRAANPPPTTSYSRNIFISDAIDYPPTAGTGAYTPPTCLSASGTLLPDPRLFRAPSSPPPPDAGNLQFAFDFTVFTNLPDSGTGGVTLKLNDYNIADRCPTDVGGFMTFLSPLQGTITNVNLGKSLSLSISAVDASGAAITNLVVPPNDLSLSITQFGVPLTVFGVEGNSPDLFKITSNNKYKANLDTGSVTGLQLGLATLCVTSINTNFTSGVGTSTATATVPPACTVINLQ